MKEIFRSDKEMIRIMLTRSCIVFTEIEKPNGSSFEINDSDADVVYIHFNKDGALKEVSGWA